MKRTPLEPPRQMGLRFTWTELSALPPEQEQELIASLAQLLLQAAGALEAQDEGGADEYEDLD